LKPTDSWKTGGSEVSLIELLTVLLQRKWFILGFSLAAAILMGILAFLIHPRFKAEASILLPQQQQSSLAALSGSLAGFGGGSVATSLGLKSPGDIYIGILGSRTIADAIIARFHLQQVYRGKLASETRKALSGHVFFTNGKDSLIRIAVEDEDPRRAANMANAYVEELYKQNSRLAITDAAHRRLFFEQEVGKAKEGLGAAETALKNTEQSTGMVAPSGQTEILIRSEAQLRAEIASREVKLQAMRSYATDENPEIEIVKSEIGTLRSQLQRLEAKGGSESSVSAHKLTDSSLEYMRKFREVKYQETLFDLLAKQYEAARIDEAKEAPMIQVMDRAEVPDRKSWPPRAMFVEVGGMLAFLLSCAWVLIRHTVRRFSEMPGHAAELQALQNALMFQRPGK
jgi:uncharacterized protein involved in exopolysaccharide biosynthesis